MVIAGILEHKYGGPGWRNCDIILMRDLEGPSIGELQSKGCAPFDRRSDLLFVHQSAVYIKET